MAPPDSTKPDENKASQRRINKPLIEKRRRARINECLLQLKSIVLEAQESQNPRPSKLEKADILEMTVEFIKKKTSEGGHTNSGRENSLHKDYIAGYTGCLAEVSKFLTETNEVNSELRETIVEHMSKKIRDCNNNDSHTKMDTEEKLEKKQNDTEKVPIPRDPTKSVVLKNEKQIPDKEKTGNKNEEKCVKDTDKTDLRPQLQLNSLQNSSAGLLCGNQVLLVLQLPPTQNMMLTQPVSLPFYNVASALQTPSSTDTNYVNCAVDLSQRISNTNSYGQISGQTTHGTDGRSAMFSSNYTSCDLRTGNTTPSLGEEVQILPLNLSKNSQQNDHPSTSESTWRPW